MVGDSFMLCHEAKPKVTRNVVCKVPQRLWTKTAFPSGGDQALVFVMTGGQECLSAHVPALTIWKSGLTSPHNKYGENLFGGPWNFKHVHGVHQHGHGGEGGRRES